MNEAEATRAILDTIDRYMATAPIRDLRGLSAAETRPALIALINTLESALKIIVEAHYTIPPRREPFPGAAEAVVRQALAAVELSRKSGLL